VHGLFGFSLGLVVFAAFLDLFSIKVAVFALSA
jgi:hypothetical protein